MIKRLLILMACMAVAAPLRADRTISAELASKTVATSMAGSDRVVILVGGLAQQITKTNLLSGLTISTTTGTVTIANSKTFTASNTITLTGTDGSTLNIGAGGTLGTAAFTASSAYQPADADLTTYAGFTPAANVQSLLGAADYSAIRTLLSLVPGTNVQAFDSDLTTYAGITPSANVQSLLAAADYSAIRTLLSLVPGTNVQAFDSDLTTYAGITPSANVQSLLGAADYSAMRTQLSLVVGTHVQAFDADLTSYAGITPSANVQSLLGAADYSAMRTLLGIDSNDAVTFGDVTVTTEAYDATGWNGDLTVPTKDAVRDKIESLASGVDFDALSAVTEAGLDSDDVLPVSADGTESKITLENFQDWIESLSLTFSSLDVTTLTIGGASVTASAAEVNILDGATLSTAELNFVDGVTSAVQTQLDAKAPLASPALTGNPTAPTASAADNDTSVATTAFVERRASGSQTGVHATPSTSNPLAPTWDGAVHTVWYGATGEIDLPAASGYSGRGILIYNTGAFTITIDPNGSEVIVRDGTVQTGGVSFTLSSGAGNYVALISDGARWITLGFKGTIAVGS